MDAGSAHAYICVSGCKIDFVGLLNDFPEWNSCLSLGLNLEIERWLWLWLTSIGELVIIVYVLLRKFATPIIASENLKTAGHGDTRVVLVMRD